MQPPSSVPELDLSATGGGYRPLLELGRGGMARVYLAERTTRRLRKLVVLKVLEPSLAASEEMRTAFRREAELCARLNHPNIVQVYEVHDEIAMPMIVMEYVDGITLAQIATRAEGRLPLRLHIHIIVQVLAGLHYFHELKDDEGGAMNAVHRDVSPQNVIVMHEGAVKVLDFGIAKLQGTLPEDATQAGIIKGKLSYMPAEQLSGDTSIDRRADIFSVGVMLWEAFAKRRIWQDRSQHDVAKSLIAGHVPSISEAAPWISKDWESIVNRAVAGKRDDRYATALDMQVEMEGCMQELGGPVQQRELANFMQAEFGAWRAERQRIVDAEARKTPVSLSRVLVDRSEHARQLSSTPSGQANLELAYPAPAGRRIVPWLALGGGAAILIAGTLAGRTLFRPADSPLVTAAPVVEKATERLVTVSITASPPGAAITFEHKPVGTNPWSAKFPSSGTLARVEVTAPGHQPFMREVSLAADVELSVVLEPSATPAAPSTVGKKSTNVVRPGHVVRAPAAAPKLNCSPPYTLDAEGVKTFKTECL